MKYIKLAENLPIGSKLTDDIKDVVKNLTVGGLHDTGLTKKEPKYETDQEIRIRVTRECSHLPDGCYKIDNNCYTGKSGYIEFMIAIEKYVRDLYIK